MAGWFYATNFNGDALLSIHSKADTNDNYLKLRLGGSGGISAYVARGGSVDGPNATASVSTGTWFHVAGVFTSNTSRTIYLNGGNSATNTTSVTPISLSELGIATYYRDSADTYDQHLVGYAADIGIWNVALTAGEIAELAAGVSACLVRPDGLVGAYRLLDNDGDVDWWGQNNLTASGSPTYTQQPPIIYPSGLLTVNQAAAGGGGGGTLPIFQHHYSQQGIL